MAKLCATRLITKETKKHSKSWFTNLGQWNVFYCALDVLFFAGTIKKRNDSMKSKRGSNIMRMPSMSAFSGLSCMRHSKAYPQSMLTPVIYRYISTAKIAGLLMASSRYAVSTTMFTEEFRKKHFHKDGVYYFSVRLSGHLTKITITEVQCGCVCRVISIDFLTIFTLINS